MAHRTSAAARPPTPLTQRGTSSYSPYSACRFQIACTVRHRVRQHRSTRGRIRGIHPHPRTRGPAQHLRRSNGQSEIIDVARSVGRDQRPLTRSNGKPGNRQHRQGQHTPPHRPTSSSRTRALRDARVTLPSWPPAARSDGVLNRCVCAARPAPAGRPTDPASTPRSPPAPATRRCRRRTDPSPSDRYHISPAPAPSSTASRTAHARSAPSPALPTGPGSAASPHRPPPPAPSASTSVQPQRHLRPERHARTRGQHRTNRRHRTHLRSSTGRQGRCATEHRHLVGHERGRAGHARPRVQVHALGRPADADSRYIKKNGTAVASNDRPPFPRRSPRSSRSPRMTMLCRAIGQERCQSMYFS
jgi:hypothetical protein